jgi:hypothetical protein
MNDHHGGIALVPPMTPYTQAEKNAHFQSIHRLLAGKKQMCKRPTIPWRMPLKRTVSGTHNLSVCVTGGYTE